MKKLLVFAFYSLLLTGCNERFNPATVSIETVQHLTHSSAIAFCNVTEDGNEFVDRKGICWSTTTHPTLNDHASDRGDQGSGAYQSPLFGLRPNTTYFIRAFAINSAGTAYSKELQITTPEAEFFTDSRDNRKYITVEIGQQRWFAENLNFNTINSSWYYLNDSLHHAKRGRLYNWESALKACPEGWKLPSIEEWNDLEVFLGIPRSEVTGFGCKGNIEGGKIKEPGILNWFYEPGEVTNETAFTAIPCGFYLPENKTFTDSTLFAWYWSSTSYSAEKAWCLKIGSSDNRICQENSGKPTGMSVRCIKKTDN